MASSVEQIDADGDALLILTRPNAPLTGGHVPLWPDHLPDHGPPEFKLDKLVLSSLKISNPAEGALETTGSSEAEDSVSERKSTTTPDIAPPVRMRLSSKHLTLASEYCRAAFAHDYAETKAESGYAYTLTAETWDHEALRVVMHVIHGQTRKVPRKVSLDMLAKIAVIVDYYKCHEAVDFF